MSSDLSELEPSIELGSYEYEDPMVRITATYPATDGTCPESIEVQIRDENPGGGQPELVVEIIEALARVPRIARTRT